MDTIQGNRFIWKHHMVSKQYFWSFLNSKFCENEMIWEDLLAPQFLRYCQNFFVHFISLRDRLQISLLIFSDN